MQMDSRWLGLVVDFSTMLKRPDTRKSMSRCAQTTDFFYVEHDVKRSVALCFIKEKKVPFY